MINDILVLFFGIVITWTIIKSCVYSEHKYFLLLYFLYLLFPSFSFFNVLNIDENVRDKTLAFVLYFLLGYLITLFVLVKASNQYFMEVNYIFPSYLRYIVFIYFIINIIMHYKGGAISKSTINSLLEGNPSLYFIIALLSTYYFSVDNRSMLVCLLIAIFSISYLSDSRLLLIPFTFSILFLSLKNKLPIKYLLVGISLFGFIAVIRVGLDVSNYFEILVTILGEFVFTRHSLDIAYENLYGKLPFADYIWLLIPSFLQQGNVKSIDSFISNSYLLDFGLASSYLNDFVLLKFSNFGFLIFGVINSIFINYLSVIFRKFSRFLQFRIFMICFFASFPIMFRSGFYYSFALIYSIIIFLIILTLVEYYLKFQTTKRQCVE
jgi:hypothetical protein